MGTTEPIRDYAELEKFRNYYLSECPNPRNYALIMLGLHTALRISDILFLRWEDIYDFSKQTCRTHLQLREHKTGKSSSIALCPAISETMNNLFEQNPGQPDDYIFSKTTSPPVAVMSLAGVSDRADGSRCNTDFRTYQLPFAAQDIWLSCMETGRSASFTDGYFQSLILPCYETLSRNFAG